MEITKDLNLEISCGDRCYTSCVTGDLNYDLRGLLPAFFTSVVRRRWRSLAMRVVVETEAHPMIVKVADGK